MIDTLVQNQIEPEWLGDVRGSDVPSVHDSSLAPALHTVSWAGALTDLGRAVMTNPSPPRLAPGCGNQAAWTRAQVE